MVEWFQERYITRDEHQSIIAYYRKLVAQLHGNVRELRAQILLLTDDTVVPEDPMAQEQAVATPRLRRDGNVIHFDFRRSVPNDA